ncbi:NAD(P)H-dependent oxidoreductase [Martelella sp. HB161492]|uniref:NAD(P)H-dependent oxidoreductase n=1 Tax=Martelella sp. HB161492 TaxID=2720726 RepID=UPI0015924B30|nr:NAD(P)H-dependent oxidoreductase [Martelella sp. HB161492]
MRVHVIYAHPLHDSLAAKLHETVVESLIAAGHQVDDLDLYAEKFDPVLSAEDRRGYHDIPENRSRIDPYVARLQAADALVLCHPVWNFGWPAILKGYFDRVFLPDVSFKLTDGKLGPGLTNIRKLATVTTYGSKRWRAAFLGDAPRKNATRFLRVVCAPGVKVEYHALYDMNNVGEHKTAAYIEKIRQAMLRF